MSEIYRASTQFVYLDIYGGTADPGSVAAVCDSPSHDHETALTVNGPTQNGDAERWTATVGLPHTQAIGELDVRWTFTMNGEPVEKFNYFDVVIPLVEIGEVRDELELGDDVTDNDIARAERRARRVIENITGQEFQSTEETIYINSSNDYSLRLPKRLISVTSVSATGSDTGAHGYRIEKDGWGLRRVAAGTEPVIGTDKDILYYHSGVPVTDPYHEPRSYWHGGKQIAISGTWGWNRVPSPIKEAALILIEERLCPESIYRERYLKTMTAADWRIEFDPGAYGGTGNVVADQILANFRVNHTAVI